MSSLFAERSPSLVATQRESKKVPSTGGSPRHRNRPIGGLPGRARLSRAEDWRNFMGLLPWGDSLKLEPEQYFDVDDERVLVFMRVTAEGEGSGSQLRCERSTRVQDPRRPLRGLENLRGPRRCPRSRRAVGVAALDE